LPYLLNSYGNRDNGPATETQENMIAELTPAQRAWQTRRALTTPATSPRFVEIKLQTVRVHEEAPLQCDTPELAADIWRQHVETASWFDSQKEALVLITLDTRCRATGYNLVSLGSLNESTASIREILRPAIVAAAYGIIIMHNHPSGDPSPSEADRRVTRRLKEACEIVGIRLFDHVVVGNASLAPHAPSGRFSFRECGLI
jgi:DNA repair protein RadC